MKFMAIATAGLATMPTTMATLTIPKQYDHKDNFAQRGAQDSHLGPHKHIGADLPGEQVADIIHKLQGTASEILEIADNLQCGAEFRQCWIPVKNTIGLLEWKLDIFDTIIDGSNVLDKCWECSEELAIYNAYFNYADTLIKALETIAKKLEHLDGDTAKYVVTAVNSLRSADYTFVYELGRRMQCDEWLKAVLEKLGKDDGSTKESVREAFALFVSTPFITGDDFKVEDGQKMNAPSETIKIETIREKACVKFSKHGKCGHHEHKEHHEAPTYHDCHNNHNSHSG